MRLFSTWTVVLVSILVQGAYLQEGVEQQRDNLNQTQQFSATQEAPEDGHSQESSRERQQSSESLSGNTTPGPVPESGECCPCRRSEDPINFPGSKSMVFRPEAHVNFVIGIPQNYKMEITTAPGGWRIMTLIAPEQNVESLIERSIELVRNMTPPPKRNSSGFPFMSPLPSGERPESQGKSPGMISIPSKPYSDEYGQHPDELVTPMADIQGMKEGLQPNRQYTEISSPSSGKVPTMRTTYAPIERNPDVEQPQTSYIPKESATFTPGQFPLIGHPQEMGVPSKLNEEYPYGKPPISDNINIPALARRYPAEQLRLPNDTTDRTSVPYQEGHFPMTGMDEQNPNRQSPRADHFNSPTTLEKYPGEQLRFPVDTPNRSSDPDREGHYPKVSTTEPYPQGQSQIIDNINSPTPGGKYPAKQLRFPIGTPDRPSGEFVEGQYPKNDPIPNSTYPEGYRLPGHPQDMGAPSQLREQYPDGLRPISDNYNYPTGAGKYPTEQFRISADTPDRPSEQYKMQQNPETRELYPKGTSSIIDDIKSPSPMGKYPAGQLRFPAYLPDGPSESDGEGLHPKTTDEDDPLIRNSPIQRGRYADGQPLPLGESPRLSAQSPLSVGAIEEHSWTKSSGPIPRPVMDRGGLITLIDRSPEVRSVPTPTGTQSDGQFSITKDIPNGRTVTELYRPYLEGQNPEGQYPQSAQYPAMNSDPSQSGQYPGDWHSIPGEFQPKKLAEPSKQNPLERATTDLKSVSPPNPGSIWTGMENIISEPKYPERDLPSRPYIPRTHSVPAGEYRNPNTGNFNSPFGAQPQQPYDPRMNGFPERVSPAGRGGSSWPLTEFSDSEKLPTWKSLDHHQPTERYPEAVFPENARNSMMQIPDHEIPNKEDTSDIDKPKMQNSIFDRPGLNPQNPDDLQIPTRPLPYGNPNGSNQRNMPLDERYPEVRPSSAEQGLPQPFMYGKNPILRGALEYRDDPMQDNSQMIAHFGRPENSPMLPEQYPAQQVIELQAPSNNWQHPQTILGEDPRRSSSRGHPGGYPIGIYPSGQSYYGGPEGNPARPDPREWYPEKNYLNNVHDPVNEIPGLTGQNRGKLPDRSYYDEELGPFEPRKNYPSPTPWMPNQPLIGKPGNHVEEYQGISSPFSSQYNPGKESQGNILPSLGGSSETNPNSPTLVDSGGYVASPVDRIKKPSGQPTKGYPQSGYGSLLTHYDESVTPVAPTKIIYKEGPDGQFPGVSLPLSSIKPKAEILQKPSGYHQSGARTVLQPQETWSPPPTSSWESKRVDEHQSPVRVRSWTTEIYPHVSSHTEVLQYDTVGSTGTRPKPDTPDKDRTNTSGSPANTQGFLPMYPSSSSDHLGNILKAIVPPGPPGLVRQIIIPLGPIYPNKTSGITGVSSPVNEGPQNRMENVPGHSQPEFYNPGKLPLNSSKMQVANMQPLVPNYKGRSELEGFRNQPYPSGAPQITMNSRNSPEGRPFPQEQEGTQAHRTQDPQGTMNFPQTREERLPLSDSGKHTSNEGQPSNIRGAPETTKNEPSNNRFGGFSTQYLPIVYDNQNPSSGTGSALSDNSPSSENNSPPGGYSIQPEAQQNRFSDITNFNNQDPGLSFGYVRPPSGEYLTYQQTGSRNSLQAVADAPSQGSSQKYTSSVSGQSEPDASMAKSLSSANSAGYNTGHQPFQMIQTTYQSTPPSIWRSKIPIAATSVSYTFPSSSSQTAGSGMAYYPSGSGMMYHPSVNYQQPQQTMPGTWPSNSQRFFTSQYSQPYGQPLTQISA